MAARTLARSHSMEPDIRLEDYLDDKLQSTTDFDNLDTLLASVEVQRSQLQTQLDDATRELDDARRAAQDRQGGLARSIDEFQQLQRSIDSRLEAVGSSAAPDAAIRRLEGPMRQLHRVDLAHSYVALLQDVEAMRTQARAHLPDSPKDALRPYSRLRQLGTRMRELQGPADEAAGHLVGYVERIAGLLWDEMKGIMSREMEALLKRRSWPHGVDPATAEMDPEWLGCFEKLVELQVPEVLYSSEDSNRTAVVLLPFEVMARPFVLWFRYQFMGDTATSSPQSFGTFCLPQFMSLIDKWADFFRDNVGYVLASHFKDTRVGDMSVYADPACALIAAMLPVLREKIGSVVHHGLRNPQFFSSLMVQLMNFDDDLRSKFDYDGGDPEKGWAGLTSEVLDVHFEYWLKAEKEFALERYRDIMSSPDARNIDYDYTGSGKMKPTFAAVRVTDLLRSVTGQYQRIRRFSHKLRFLIDIQLEILDEYHDRLRDSLEAYSTITSTLGRTLHGVTREQAAALEGTGALETLCKVLGSSDHVVTTLNDWSNEEFFVELWDQLQTRAKMSSRDQENLAGGMSYDHVKDRTSSSVGLDGDGGILFDETIAAYSNRRKSAEQYLVGALVESHQKAFRVYAAKAHWSIVNDEISADPSQLSPSPELNEPLAILKRNLTFLLPALSTAVFRRVWRDALERLQASLWNDVLLAHRFTALGAAQLVRDVDAVCSVVDRHCAAASGGSGSSSSSSSIMIGTAALAALRDGARLLSLPLENVGSITDGSKDDDDDAGADAWGGDDKETAAAGDGGGAADASGNNNEAPKMSLREASDRFFKDNAEAKLALEELGMDGTLTPANARNIVQRRVENQE